MSRTPNLQMIMHRDTDGELKLWACRGEGKGCSRNRFRQNKKPCADCVPAHDKTETIGQLTDRLARGDA